MIEIEIYPNMKLFLEIGDLLSAKGIIVVHICLPRNRSAFEAGRQSSRVFSNQTQFIMTHMHYSIYFTKH
jgi:hypothetical protein